MAVRQPSTVQPEVSVPLVVVGAGACGLTAALSAAELGVQVLVLERDAQATGSTSLSAGLIPAAATRLQRARGIPDSAEQFAQDLIAKAHGENDAHMVHAVARASGAVVDWLMDTHKLDLRLVDGFLFPGHTVCRMHGPPSQTGADLQNMLLAAAQAADIDIMTSASVEDIHVDAANRITAVSFRRPDGTQETVGCAALILACNGFGGNPEKVRQYIPEMAQATYCGHPSNTGDALDWGLALGAQTADLGAYQGHGSVCVPHNLPLTWAATSLGGFQVNCAGRRFANEMLGYSEHAREVLRQPGGFAWMIFDARCEVPALGFEDYRQIHALGGIRQADSVETLAHITGLPLATLQDTLNHVRACARGARADPLGRDFTQHPPLVPPYCVAKVCGALFHTQGGLVIDTDARVLDRHGQPLPNLFAGGGAARGLSGAGAHGYLSGNGLLSAIVFGRFAGLAAARQLAT